MKYLQESRKSIYIIAGFLGICLTIFPAVAVAHPNAQFNYSGEPGNVVSATNNARGTYFNATIGPNASVPAGGMTFINFVGRGGNDTFYLGLNNATAETPVQFTATGNTSAPSDPAHSNHFLIGDSTFATPLSTGTSNSTFSMVSGPYSWYNITQSNLASTGLYGTQVFSIQGGHNSTLVEQSVLPLWTTIYSINLGANSTVTFKSLFENANTTINVIF